MVAGGKAWFSGGVASEGAAAGVVVEGAAGRAGTFRAATSAGWVGMLQTVFSQGLSAPWVVAQSKRSMGVLRSDLVRIGQRSRDAVWAGFQEKGGFQ